MSESCNRRACDYLIVAMLFVVLAADVAIAASFVEASYDGWTDELVVTLAYRGTNPNHRFFLEWDKCRERSAEGKYEIAARVHDSQWDDLAREPFETTVRFPLHELSCRPATVTLFTEPHFRVSVFVPAKRE